MTDNHPGFVKSIQHPIPGFQFTNEAEAPEVDPKPKFVYGHLTDYNNMFLNNEGNVVYCAAGCGVVFNPKTREQKIFNKHNDDVEAVAMHPGFFHFVFQKKKMDFFDKIFFFFQ